MARSKAIEDQALLGRLCINTIRLERGLKEASFEIWFDKCVNSKLYAQKVRTAANRLYNHLLWVSLEAWKQLLQQTRRMRGLQRRLLVILRSKIGTVFRTWVSFHQHDIETRVKINRFLRKLLHTTAYKAFQTWWHTTTTDRRHRMVQRNCWKKIAQRGLSRAFEAWIASIVEIKTQRTRVARCVAKILNQSSNEGTWKRHGNYV